MRDAMLIAQDDINAAGGVLGEDRAPLQAIVPALRELIGGDERFFAPVDEEQLEGDHNYSGNERLIEKIAAGARRNAAASRILRDEPSRRGITRSARRRPHRPRGR